MKIAIAYPNDKVLKMKTLRYLKKSGIGVKKVTWIADILNRGTIDELKSLGNEIIELNNSNDSKRKWTDEDIRNLMNFFQKNKGNLKLSSEDKDFFKNIVKRFKSGKNE